MGYFFWGEGVTFWPVCLWLPDGTKETEPCSGASWGPGGLVVRPGMHLPCPSCLFFASVASGSSVHTSVTGDKSLTCLPCRPDCLVLPGQKQRQKKRKGGSESTGQQFVPSMPRSLPVAGRLGWALQSPHGLCLSIFKLLDKSTSLFKDYSSLRQFIVSFGSKIWPYFIN